MDLQKHNQELTQSNGTLLVKVSDEFYQKWWELAYQWNCNGKPIQERQEEMYALLCEWARNLYPEYGIVAFQDLNEDEARKISYRTGKLITWGMYVLLQIGGSMQPMDIHQLLTEGPKLIEL